MLTPRIRELKANLDRLLDSPLFSDDWTEAERAVHDEAAGNFRRAGPEVLTEATPYLRMYYEEIRRQFPDGTPEIPEDTDIWKHVPISKGPEFAVGGKSRSPAPSNISFEGEVSWEREHGLQLVFEHGGRVCKVGP